MNNNYNDISSQPLEDTIRKEIGLIIKPDEIENIASIIDRQNINNEKMKINIQKMRKEYIYNFNSSAIEAYKLYSD